MASEEAEKKQEEQQGASYTYWVRQVKEGDAAPLPVPRKLTPDDIINDSNSQPPNLGSLWNKAGTWEEKNLNKWASDRIKELLISLGSLEFPAGKAEISDVSKCVGDAFLVTVRNKKRVGYTYELTLKVKGEWTIREEKKTVKGHIDIPEFSFGELDDLQCTGLLVCTVHRKSQQSRLLKKRKRKRKRSRKTRCVSAIQTAPAIMEVRLSEEKDLLHQDKSRISQDLKLFLQPVREKMLQFEQELKDR